MSQYYVSIRALEDLGYTRNEIDELDSLLLIALNASTKSTVKASMSGLGFDWDGKRLLPPAVLEILQAALDSGVSNMLNRYFAEQKCEASPRFPGADRLAHSVDHIYLSGNQIKVLGMLIDKQAPFQSVEGLCFDAEYTYQRYHFGMKKSNKDFFELISGWDLQNIGRNMIDIAVVPVTVRPISMESSVRYNSDGSFSYVVR